MEISRRKKNWSRVPDRRLTPRQTGRLTVGRKLTSTSVLRGTKQHYTNVKCKYLKSGRSPWRLCWTYYLTSCRHHGNTTHCCLACGGVLGHRILCQSNSSRPVLYTLLSVQSLQSFAISAYIALAAWPQDFWPWGVSLLKLQQNTEGFSIAVLFIVTYQ
jgi:hypothetical protein